MPGTIHCKSIGIYISLGGIYTSIWEYGESADLGMRRILSLGFSCGSCQPALDKSVHYYESQFSHLKAEGSGLDDSYGLC